MPYVLKPSGARLDLLNPDPKDIVLEDIAESLARIRRFNGDGELCVAAHSICVAALCPPEDRLWALLHDASEAYIADVPGPVKQLLPDYQALEARIQSAICERFGLPQTMPASVKGADRHMLICEMRDSDLPSRQEDIGATDEEWNLEWPDVYAALGERVDLDYAAADFERLAIKWGAK